MIARPLDGQVALVTGGGKGLGRAFALHLSQLGAAVLVNNRNREVDADGRGPADHVVAEIEAAGGSALADHHDVTEPGAAEAMVGAAVSRWGRLDICVTSAGVSSPQMFHRTTPENIAQVLGINVTGTALVAAAASAVMREAGHGRIVLVASAAGLHGEPTVSAYAASKGAVIALGRTIAVEGERRGVLTNVLLPYATTQMTETGMDTDHAERMTPEVVAPVVGALVHPESTLNGQVLLTGGRGLRAASTVEHGTVLLPEGSLDPGTLARLLTTSREQPATSHGHALEAFRSLAEDVVALTTNTDPPTPTPEG